MIFRSMTELIGATPLVELCRYREQEQLGARILAKLESFNPAGSAKDRIALRMIEDAEQTGRLQPGATIIEPTSGNTGIGLAAVAAARGYKAIFIMPETMSVERRKLLAVYGAQIVLTPGREGMQGAVDKAAALAQEIPGALVLGQFVNAFRCGAVFEGAKRGRTRGGRGASCIPAADGGACRSPCAAGYWGKFYSRHTGSQHL